MEIKVFNNLVNKRRGSGKPCLHISESGIFNFNKQACYQLNLVKGTTISIAQDETNPRDWYFFRDPKGLELRHYKGKDTILSFSSKLIRDCIFKSVGTIQKHGSMSFLLATEPTQHNELIMFAILTNSQL